MRRHIIAGVLLLGLLGVTFALAQPGAPLAKVPPVRVVPVPEPTRDGVKVDQAKLDARVAGLRAEVELLQLEHDALKAVVSDLWKGLWKLDAELLEQAGAEEIADHYARLGAELVGKAAEYEKATQENRAAFEKTMAPSRPIPTELQRRKQDFLRVTTELNQKKIELVELETRLDSSL
jgi:hypothetical protein